MREAGNPAIRLCTAAAPRASRPHPTRSPTPPACGCRSSAASSGRASAGQRVMATSMRTAAGTASGSCSDSSTASAWRQEGAAAEGALSDTSVQGCGGRGGVCVCVEGRVGPGPGSVAAAGVKVLEAAGRGG